MTTINTANAHATLINVFTVEPEKARALADLLERATEETMRHVPGFISANIHKSLDGVRVTNYAQWRSREHFEAMLRHPEAIPHMQACAALAESAEPHLYDVASVHNKH